MKKITAERTARISRALPGPTLRVDAGAPDDNARQRRLAWAVLMKRTFGLDVLEYPT